MKRLLWSHECKGCDQDISPRAQRCPNCDTDNPVEWTLNQRWFWPIALSGLALFALALVGLGLLNGPSTTYFVIAGVVTLIHAYFYVGHLRRPPSGLEGTEPPISWPAVVQAFVLCVGILDGLQMAIQDLPYDTTKELGGYIFTLGLTLVWYWSESWTPLDASGRRSRKLLDRYGLVRGTPVELGCWRCGEQFSQRTAVCYGCGEQTAHDGRRDIFLHLKWCLLALFVFMGFYQVGLPESSGLEITALVTLAGILALVEKRQMDRLVRKPVNATPDGR